MRILIGMIAAAAFAVAPIAAEAKSPISKAQISDVLTAEGYSVRDSGANRLSVAAGDQLVYIVVDGADGDISYIAWMSGLTIQQVGHPFLSKFNSEVKFGRAYVDRDGDITIQMDRNSSGGVSLQNVVSDFDVFVQLVSRFMSELQRQAST